MRGRATSVVLPALVVLVLVAIVGIAATGSTPSGDGSTRSPSESLLDTLFTLGLDRSGDRRRAARLRADAAKGDRARDRLGTSSPYIRRRVRRPLRTLHGGHVLAPERVEGAPTERGGRPSARASRRDARSDPASRDRDELRAERLVASDRRRRRLLLAALGAYVVAERRANRGRRSGEELAEQLAVVLDETLDDLRAEADPRRAIIAAYARLERVLAANGVPRRVAETSNEYLARVLQQPRARLGRRRAPDSALHAG